MVHLGLPNRNIMRYYICACVVLCQYHVHAKAWHMHRSLQDENDDGLGFDDDGCGEEVSLFGSLDDLLIFEALISLIGVIAVVLLLEFVFMRGRNYLRTTPFFELGGYIERELVVIGTMTFSFKILFNTHHFLSEDWKLALEYSDLLVPMTAFASCGQGFVLLISSLEQTRNWKRYYFARTSAAIRKYGEARESTSILASLGFSLPLRQAISGLEFRICHTIFCEHNLISHETFRFDSYVDKCYRLFLQEAIDLKIVDWFFVVIIMALLYSRELIRKENCEDRGEDIAGCNELDRISNYYFLVIGAAVVCSSVVVFGFSWYYRRKVFQSVGVSGPQDYVRYLTEHEARLESEKSVLDDVRLSMKDLKDHIRSMVSLEQKATRRKAFEKLKSMKDKDRIRSRRSAAVELSRRSSSKPDKHDEPFNSDHVYNLREPGTSPRSTSYKGAEYEVIAEPKAEVSCDDVEMTKLPVDGKVNDYDRDGFGNEDPRLIQLASSPSSTPQPTSVTSSGHEQVDSTSTSNPEDIQETKGEVEMIKADTQMESKPIDDTAPLVDSPQTPQEAILGIPGVRELPLVPQPQYTSTYERLPSRSYRENGSQKGRRTRKDAPVFKTEFLSDSHVREFNDIFIGGNPVYYFRATFVLSTLVALFFSLWATNYISTARKIDRAMQFATFLPSLISFLFLWLSMPYVVQLKALAGLNREIVNEVIDQSEEAISLGQHIRERILGQNGGHVDRLELIEAIYAEFDLTDEGYISGIDFKMYLHEIGVEISEKLWDDIFLEIDLDFDNHIEKTELLAFLFPEDLISLDVLRREQEDREREQGKQREEMENMSFRKMLGFTRVRSSEDDASRNSQDFSA